MNRSAGAHTLADQVAYLADEAAVFQDHEVGMENGGIVLRQGLADPLHGVSPGSGERDSKIGFFARASSRAP